MQKQTKNFPVISARCSPGFKSRLSKRLRSCGATESDFLRVAVAEFLDRHKGRALVAAYRAGRAAESIRAEGAR